jgi:DNA polymerase elongation subunit (family B)
MIPIFPYSWHIHNNEIHVYGFEEDSSISLVRITGFTPYVYIKLPNHIDWNQGRVFSMIQFLKKNNSIYKAMLMHKRGLYFANVKIDESGHLKHNLNPYIFMAFNSESDRKHFIFNTRKKQNIPGVGAIDLEFYEHNASPVLQFTCLRQISTADWFGVQDIQDPEEKISRCKNEYSVAWKSVCALAPEQIPTQIPDPLILSYDIECNFHDPNKFSDGSHIKDVVFQISCVFGRQTQPKEKWEKYLLTLGNPSSKYLEDTQVLSYNKEFKLLLGFCDLIVKKSPQILIGYNIFKFDIPFLYKRAINLRIQDDFVRHGYTRERCKLETIRWSSSAYSNQEMNFFDLKGRLTIDVLTLLQRDFNLESYKLDAVAEKFLNSKKDPLNHLDIFMCYKRGMKETEELGVSDALSMVGKYCVKDSVLVLELFQKFQYWYSLTEMAKICQVPHSHLYLHGQQLKVFSQVYRYCFSNNIVVESGRFKSSEDEYCAGAYVLSPIPGLYENVVSLDFSSMYPSIIISHNIDFTTLVEEDSKIPEHYCQTIEWEEHINCKCLNATLSKDNKDIRCKKYKYKWLKDIPGILPVIIRDLLEARKQVRKRMKEIDPNSLEYNILNNRQLAYKVSGNSMYGALSARKGYLPFLPAGMCVTAVGRQSIEKVCNVIQKDYQGQVIYGDTDSNYVVFRHLKTLKEIWEYSEYVADQVSKLFPDPMKLEFENNIYARYLILSKKRYLYYTIDLDGNMSKKIENKGVLLKRRDNSKVVRDIYEDLVRMVLNQENEFVILEKLLFNISLLVQCVPELDYYSISKSVKDIEYFNISYRDSKTIQYGDYVVPKLKEDSEQRQKQLEDKGARSETDFYQSHLPGPVQLALRMRKRGQHVSSGSRISYIISKKADHKSNASERMEELEYFKMFMKKDMIDSLYYLHLLINPIEEVLVVMYGSKYKNFIKDMYKNRLKYELIMNRLKSLMIKIDFVE